LLGSFAFLEFLEEFKRFFRGIYPINRFKSPKYSILGEGQFAKKFEFFPRKFNRRCYKLFEMC